MIERDFRFRFASSSGQDGNAMMQASSASSSIQQDDFRHNAEVEVAESGCSECVCGRSGSVPQKAEVNYNLRKRKHPAWMWLMLMQQLMALLLSLPAKTGSKRCGWRVLPVWMATVILLLPAGLALDVSSIPLPPPSDVVPRQPNESGICSSLDIRNSAEKLRELENCTVVEGFVNIVLIEEDKEAAGGRGSFAGHSYPNLREITGYLLLYRVYGLTSLKDLFPNLAVIRGQELFYDYSLVVYELMALKELGLRSLTYIQRGSVLIEKNPNLCYVESINWNQITVKGEHNFIHSNKKPSECRACPDRCPTSRNGNSRVCWNNELCQKVCPRDCQDRGLSCNVTTATREQENSQSSRSRHFCCHEQCAGGCSGPGSHQCHVCKNVAHNDDCLSMCPTSYYLHYERRCVTQQECVRMAYPPDRESHKSPWKPIEGNAVEKPQCRLECPAGHKEVNATAVSRTSVNSTNYLTCEKCNGACPKECLGALVNNIETAQRLKGCSTIDGDLEMQIKGGPNIIQELEKNLGDIEEIRGTLKIVRSFPLLSLNFFKRLRVITGYPPDELNRYALVIQDNQNLQQLWNVDDGRNMSIGGKMMFHFNPKLCFHLIVELFEKARPPGSPHFRETDVSQWSNGDKATCNEEELNVTVTSKSDKSILLRWGSEFRELLPDKRLLLGYVISYIEAPHQNVTYYDGRDACGGDGWIIKDEVDEHYIMTELKPYTQYALYVQTSTVAPIDPADRTGARSPIIYETTNAAEPSQPKNLIADATSSSELKISWQQPEFPNGIVTHYKIRGILIEEDQKYYDDQDSCAVSSENQVKRISDEPSSSANNRSSSTLSTSSRSSSSSSGGADCCECTAKNVPKTEHTAMEKDRQFKINFENYLHNKVYVKNTLVSTKGRRSKRGADGADSGVLGAPNEFPTESINDTGHFGGGPDAKGADYDWLAKDPEEFTQDGKLLYFYKMVNVTDRPLEVLVVGALHYAEYTIEVVACHDWDPNTNKTLYSRKAVTSVRTKELENSDDIIDNLTLGEYNYTDKSIKVGWKEPKKPNGLIIKYILEYQRTDANSNAIKRECVRQKEFLAADRTKTLVDLSPGEYWIQVRAQSLAKLGEASAQQKFTIYEQDKAMDWRIILGIVLVALFIPIFFIGIGGYYIIKKRRHIQTITSINPDYHKYEVDGWEVARDNVDLLRELGQGSFGMVYEGIVRNVVYQQPEAKCAVKTVNDKASVTERIQFLNEASVMKEFNSHHVVKLLGVVSKAQPTLVIMELMANGDLKTYLRLHRPDLEENIIEGRQPPTLKCILKMAIEIADGMSYLADKKFVHRDVAARNCMVAEDLTVKIGDFGMTRDIYETDYYRKGGKGLLPVRWMAPESLRDGVFTSQSDVWSYGVVLWEMATLASQPYQGLSSEQVLKYVLDGRVMERPERCPDRLYDLMKSCWYYQAKHRPTFLDIIADLLPDVPAQFASVSFYHSDVGVVARAAQKAYHEQENRKLNDPSTPLRSSIDLVDDDDMYSSRESVHKGSNGAFYARDQAFQIDDDLLEEEEAAAAASTAAADCFELEPQQQQQQQQLEEEEDDEENAAEDRCLSDATDGDDHVAVLIPKDQKVYVLVKNPTSNGSKSDAAKGTTTVSSEDSKGSYVSNGSASNGYVMGILKQRRQNNTEC